MSIRIRNKLKPKSHNLKPQSGFSLVELMVTISIFVIITSITLTNYPKFSNKLSLDLLAQDIALSLRQAQIFGSSVFGAKSSGGPTRVFKAYGVHFNAPTVGQIIYPYFLFADIDNPLRFDAIIPPDPTTLLCGEPTSANECVQKFLVTGRNKVKLLCKDFIDSGIPAEQRVGNCEDANNNNQLSSLDIVFVRPNLDAKFTAVDLIGNQVANVSNVGIILESLGGDYNKTVVVWKTGQISVE